MGYIVDRIKEFSTFSAVILFVAGLAGWTLSPELIEAWHMVVISVLSAVGVLTPDKE